MWRLPLCLVVFVPSASTAILAETAAPRLQWQINVECAAGYQANWQNRMSIRAPSMSNGIQLQVEDYKAAAVRHYQKEENASPENAKQKIESYLAANVSRFIAMDKAGTLEAFIEQCPQLEEPN